MAPLKACDKVAKAKELRNHIDKRATPKDIRLRARPERNISLGRCR